MAKPHIKWRNLARRVVRKTKMTAPIEWQAFWRSRPVDQDVVLYESFAGNGMLCNPEAIFRVLLDAPDQQHLRHVWVLNDLKQYQKTVDEFAGDSRVSFVRYRSPGYFRVLATAGLLINNATFPPEFGKRAGQTYVNTWHGTPLKRMGYDQPGGVPDTRNVIRNFVSADYLLSASEFMTTQMYETAYRLRNIYRGKIIQEGYPRTDRQHLAVGADKALFRKLRAHGVSVRDDRKTVLYAPTWRGESFYAPTNDAAILRERVRALRAELPEDWQVLLKVHQQVYQFAAAHPDLRDVLVPNHIATNEILGITDLLVNDYSSVFFDFLSTGKPVVFFVPDIDSYTDSRGLYLDVSDLPGPVVRTVPELALRITATGTGSVLDPILSHTEAYRASTEKFAPLDDGRSAERVIDVVLRGRASEYDVRDAISDGRESILVFLGGMRSNGITTSALSLLDNIDHKRFDVSVLYVYSRNKDQLKNEAAINSEIRLFPRVGDFAPGKRHRRRRRRLLRGGATAPAVHLDAVSKLFKDEWTRCLGDSKFDFIVDFSGYAPFWSFLLAQGPARARSVWLHNDLQADQVREVNGRRPHEKNLGSVFPSYRFFDHLVSVSSELCDINATKLSPHAPREKFTWALNTINHERIRALAFGDETAVAGESAEDFIKASRRSPSRAVEALMTAFDLDALETELQRRLTIAHVVPPANGVTTFVTVGRLSPEKNHRRLLLAFDLVHQKEPQTRLVIVGSGPLRIMLIGLAEHLGLAESVTFAGHQDNPYAIMANSDCFVLSSDYEGQPMVLLEARVLGLPIVSTAFESVLGALPEGVGTVVPQTHEALAQGMLKAIKGEVPNPSFDPEAYNLEAIDDFYRAIGADQISAGQTEGRARTF